MDISSLVLAVVLQVLFSDVWFEVVMAGPYSRAIAVDHGVKGAAFVRNRHSPIMTLGLSCAVAAVRTAAVAKLTAFQYGLHATLADRMSVALCVFSIALLSTEVHARAQRSWAVIRIEALYQLCSLMLVATLSQFL
jgi:hypothetical protein